MRARVRARMLAVCDRCALKKAGIFAFLDPDSLSPFITLFNACEHSKAKAQHSEPYSEIRLALIHHMFHYSINVQN